MTVRVVCLLRACAWQGDFHDQEEADAARNAHYDSQRHQRAMAGVVPFVSKGRGA